MDRSEWDDEDGAAYPPAPLPAHEREWRHPSEVASETWARTEPPLVIGRGLTVATGVLGLVLTVALVWTLVPTDAGTASVVSVRSTLDGSSFSLSPTVDATAPTQDNLAPPATDAPDSTAADTAATASSTTHPMPTYQVTYETNTRPGAVAVALHGGRLVVTTATAVGADSVELLTPDGGTNRAQVLFVDARSGLAVLAPTARTAAEAFEVAAAVADGDTLTVMADPAVEVIVGADGVAGLPCGDNPELPEGTPVVDAHGALVALCTITEAGASVMIPVADLDALRRAMGSAVAPTVWLGVVVNDNPAGTLTVGAVDPDGPAAAAGFDVGDTIVSVDGEPVADVAELAGLLALHQPGDVVVIVVTCPDGTQIEVDVHLAPPKPSL
ncbi:MAG: PDZ domain-containing protein [Ilumatobacteraceae bacterium]|nr:PDZ domain-containing protein [Ilumatobacter sp.]MCB9382020.1 PDZ domain-containing protein [Acidimicrobiaceae bacterium]MCO5329999.1 PDZ domain-containing protein [Ilumatobacteraceae bacterium]